MASQRPLLLLAHTFTQHTAGLSGGRVVKRMARKYMQLPEEQGGCCRQGSCCASCVQPVSAAMGQAKLRQAEGGAARVSGACECQVASVGASRGVKPGTSLLLATAAATAPCSCAALQAQLHCWEAGGHLPASRRLRPAPSCRRRRRLKRRCVQAARHSGAWSASAPAVAQKFNKNFNMWSEDRSAPLPTCAGLPPPQQAPPSSSSQVVWS